MGQDVNKCLYIAKAPICTLLSIAMVGTTLAASAKGAAGSNTPPKPGSYIQNLGLGGPPSQAEPELRQFAKEIAVKVRHKWWESHKPIFLPVYVSFNRDGQPIYISGDDDDDKRSRAAAEQLVSRALEGVHPPKGKTYGGFAVNFFFDSYPDRITPDPRVGSNYKNQTSYDPSSLYEQLLVERVTANWKSDLTPPVDEEHASVIRLEVDRTGKLSSATITSGSGNKGYDQTELDAVKASFPFLPLPPGYPSKAKFDLHFMYKKPSHLGNAVDLNFYVHLAQPEVVRTEELRYTKSR